MVLIIFCLKLATVPARILLFSYDTTSDALCSFLVTY